MNDPASAVAVECATAVLHKDYPAAARAIGDFLGCHPSQVSPRVMRLVGAQASLFSALVIVAGESSGLTRDEVMERVGLAVALKGAPA